MPQGIAKLITVGRLKTTPRRHRQKRKRPQVAWTEAAEAKEVITLNSSWITTPSKNSRRSRNSSSSSNKRAKARVKAKLRKKVPGLKAGPEKVEAEARPVMTPVNGDR